MLNRISFFPSSPPQDSRVESSFSQGRTGKAQMQWLIEKVHLNAHLGLAFLLLVSLIAYINGTSLWAGGQAGLPCSSHLWRGPGRWPKATFHKTKLMTFERSNLLISKTFKHLLLFLSLPCHCTPTLLKTNVLCYLYIYVLSSSKQWGTRKTHRPVRGNKSQDVLYEKLSFC